jgi:hypothetical protein
LIKEGVHLLYGPLSGSLGSALVEDGARGAKRKFKVGAHRLDCSQQRQKLPLLIKEGVHLLDGPLSGSLGSALVEDGVDERGAT